MNNLPFNLPPITAFRELDYTLRLNIDLSYLDDPDITFQVWDGNVLLYTFSATYDDGTITGVFQDTIVRKMPTLSRYYILINGVHKFGSDFTTALTPGLPTSNTLEVELVGDTYVTVEIPGFSFVSEATAVAQAAAATATEKADELSESAANALTSEQNAALSEMNAAISEDNALTSASSALLHKTAAELARDTSLIQAGVYDTEALGRAAVADGQYFKVAGSGDVAANEYKRINSTTSSLINSYPSAGSVSTFKGQITDVDYNGTPFTVGAPDTLSTYTSSTNFNLRIMAFTSLIPGMVNRLDFWSVKAGTLNLRIFKDNKDGTYELLQKISLTITLGANSITTGFTPFYFDADIRVGVFYNASSGLIGYKTKSSGVSFGAASAVDPNVGDDVAINIASTAEFGIVLYVSPESGRKIKQSALPIEIPDVVSLYAFNRGRSDKSYVPKKYGILVAGQSNTDGAIPYAEIPSWFVTAGRLIPGVNFSKNPGTGFSTYTVADGSLWAYDLFLYKSMIDYLRTKHSDPTYEMYVIKQSVSGTSISVDAKPTSPGYWDINFEKIPTNKPAITKEWEKRLKTILAAVTTFDLRCVVWHQGESDQGDPDTYYQNLNNLIWYVRGVLNMPKLVWILGGINTSSTSFNQKVQDAKIKLAAEDRYIEYVEVLNGSSYLGTDSLHWNAVGAQDFSDKVFNLIKDIEPSTNLNGGYY